MAAHVGDQDRAAAGAVQGDDPEIPHRPALLSRVAARLSRKASQRVIIPASALCSSTSMIRHG